MAMDAGSDTDTKFAPIDWEEGGTSTILLSRRTVAFLITLGILGALFCYDWFIVSGANPTLTVGRFSWDITRLDWLFLLSLLALVFYGVVPLVRNPQQTRLYWQRLRTNKLAVVSLLYLVIFFPSSVLWDHSSSGSRDPVSSPSINHRCFLPPMPGVLR